MVPISIPGGNHYVAMAISLICLSTLLTWCVSLVRNPDSRLWLAEHRRLGPTLMALLALAGGVFPVQHISAWMQAQRESRAEAARRLTLDAATELAGVRMPAGTELRLGTAGQPDTFISARFPAPTRVAGVDAITLTRYQGAAPGAAHTWSLTTATDQRIEGWTCMDTHPLEFRIQDGQPRFASCHLAAGNQVEAKPLPAGAWLASRANEPGWLVRTDGSEAVGVDQLPLLKVELRLSPERRRLSFEGLLAGEATLGEVTYPAGTRVASAGPKVPGAQPGDLLFSPSRGRSARRAGGTDIPSGKSVLQAAGGEVRAVLSNREAGVLDVASVRLGP
ncbi:hypothetical protein CEK29_02045 [Bordetella genomosp. 5]|uniref:Uncharacterized protein n=1 Tax=Bordetella genomosp. 5 TaxID=1395608 RepID=A0A261U0K2_9BORD|nr:hypothetical protein [Bordetella genomosp. 5]OZI47545.1 hypothetical protein CEK29_02045 [Bordetella genomosp. 5]OZI55478.1 hypothetical protein CAL25_03525 [Bordetella genomosp. 5]